MTATLTKYFSFSASYSKGQKVTGHNYVLGVTTGELHEHEETFLERGVREALIQKVHSRDFGDHVEFLKGTDFSDHALLKAFWPVIQEAVKPIRLEALSLERDGKTKAELQ